MDELEKRSDAQNENKPETKAQAANVQAKTAQPEPPVDTVASEKPGKNHPELGKLLRILLPAAALVLILTFVVSAVASSPLKKVEQALQNTLNAATESQVSRTLEESITGGSMSIRLGLNSVAEQLLGAELDGEISATLYADGKKSRSALDASAVLDGETVVDAVLFAEPDAIAVSSKALLPDGAVGVKLSELGKNLKTSVFNPDSDTMYALDEDTFEMISRLQDKAEKPNGKLGELAKKTLQELYDTLMSALDHEAEISTETDELDFADDTVKVRNVIMELDAKAMTHVAEDLLHWEKDSESLRELLKQLTTEYRELLKAAGNEDLEAYTDQFYDKVDEALENLDELEDTLEDITATLRFSIYKKALVQIHLELEKDDEKMWLCASIGPDVRSPSEITVQMNDGYDSYAFNYEVTENSSNAYTAKLKVKENSDTVASGIISWDRKSGELWLTLSNDTDAIALGGTMTHKGKETRITIGRIETGGESLDLDLSLVLRQNDNVPALPKFKDVLTITDEDELTELVETLSENVEALVGALF